MISFNLSKAGVVLAAAAFTTVVSFAALAQDKAATPPKTDKPATKPVAKTPSACKGLDETACKGKSAECSWIGATKTAAGKDRKAYCRSKPKPKAKT